MARVAALFALVAGASATLDASPFGNSVLAELESKLAAGTPLDELKSILQDIRARLNLASQADIAAQDADTDYCTERAGKLSTDITLESEAISALNATINANELVVENAQKEMDKLTIEIADLERQKKENEDEQTRRNDEREDQNTDWIAGKTDAKICLGAIEDIKTLPELGLLSRKQGDNAGNFQQGVRLSAMVEALSSKVTHPQVQSFVQLAALAMAASETGNDDVDRLLALVQKLEDELNQYIVDIAADEAALLRQHTIAIADLRTTHAHIVDTIAAKRAQFQVESDKKAFAEDRIQADTAEMNEAQASKNALVTELSDLNSGCAARSAAHDVREQERVDESATIDKIERILEEKLAKHFGGHLVANITSA